TANGAYTGSVVEVPVAVSSGSGSGTGVDTDFTFNIGEAVYFDQTFYDNTYDPVWFDVPGDQFLYDGTYPSGASQIQLTVQLDGSYQDSIEYEYYYCATQPTSVDDFTYLETGEAGITTYGTYDYYDCDYSGTVQNGYYLCALYPDSTGDILAYNVCKVG
ncbi:MAG: hypothetical protein IKT14_01940, partial [Clostridiales bacterium]|nr:hypothetical protein [Clostridiales bacterium]